MRPPFFYYKMETESARSAAQLVKRQLVGGQEFLEKHLRLRHVHALADRAHALCGLDEFAVAGLALCAAALAIALKIADVRRKAKMMEKCSVLSFEF